MPKIANILLYCILLAIGALIGGFAAWVASFSDGEPGRPIAGEMEELISVSHTPITADNFSCPDYIKREVGAVMSAILSDNLQNTRNMSSFGCYDKTCSFSVTDCKPWQHQECGGLYLVYEVDENGAIDPSSFRCVQMP